MAIIFLFLNQNICCGYSKEPSQREGSFEHPKHMLNILDKLIFTILRCIFLLFTFSDLYSIYLKTIDNHPCSYLYHSLIINDHTCTLKCSCRFYKFVCQKYCFESCWKLQSCVGFQAFLPCFRQLDLQIKFVYQILEIQFLKKMSVFYENSVNPDHLASDEAS